VYRLVVGGWNLAGYMLVASLKMWPQMPFCDRIRT